MLPDDVLLLTTFDFCAESEASRSLKLTFGNQFSLAAMQEPFPELIQIGWASSAQ